MKTKTLVTLLLVGLNTCGLVCYAQNNPGQDSNVQKLYNQPGDAAKQAAAPAAAPVEPVETAEILPLVQFEDAPLVDVIKTLARQANLNLVFDPRVTAPGPDGKPVHPPVSIRLEKVTAQNVLEAVLNNNNLRLERDAKTKISRVTIKDPAAAEPLVTKVYQLKYSFPTNLVSIIKPAITARSQVIPDPRTSQLIVLATEKELIDIDALIEKLDTPTRQVLIEARIVETSRNPSSVKGINWAGTFENQALAFGNNVNGGAGGRYDKQVSGTVDPVLGNVVTTTYGGNQLLPQVGPQLLVDTAKGLNPATAFLDADGVRAVFSFFNRDSESELLSTPRTVTQDNQPALLNVSQLFPIFKVTSGGTQTGPTVDITYTNIGTILTVTPRISANDTVSLKVIPEVSALDGVDQQSVPTQTGSAIVSANRYSVRRIETQVLIPSGNTLVMGGLVRDDIRNNRTKVPILGDLPGLGHAFRTRSKTRDKRNLIVFVTPTIITEDDFQAAPASDFLKRKPAPDKPENDPGPFTNPMLDSAEPHDWTKPVY
jgi:type II secretory pathway component GspD/PulD (secretin)